MIKEIQSIDSDKKVKSRDMREYADKVYARLSKTYHRTMQTAGNARTSAVCLSLLNSSMSNVLSFLGASAANKRVISPYDTAIYPVSSFHRVEKDTGLMTFSAKKISTSPVFTDTQNNIYESISATREITTADNLPTTSIVENDIVHLLIGDIPYLIRVAKTVTSRVSVSITISTDNSSLPINTIKYLPMPSAGIVTLDSISFNSGEKIVMNGSKTLDDSTGHVFSRTFQGLLNFNEIKMSTMNIVISSETYLSNYDCVAIGLSYLKGEYNTYAQKSYIGWAIPYPLSYTNLTKIKAYAANYSSSLDNVNFRLYSSEAEFLAVSDNYINTFASECDYTIGWNIDQSLYPDLYLMMEITTENNITPCVGKIELEFE